MQKAKLILLNKEAENDLSRVLIAAMRPDNLMLSSSIGFIYDLLCSSAEVNVSEKFKAEQTVPGKLFQLSEDNPTIVEVR